MDPCRASRPSLGLLSLFAALLTSWAAADESTDRRCSVASAGDVNGDGACDVAVAERGFGAIDFMTVTPEPTLDRVWILSGTNGALLRTLHPPRECPAFGRALENVGDLNGDGRPELAVSGGGPLWVFSGVDGSVLYELAGELAGDEFGRSLGGGEDVDGDGTPDLVVVRAPRGFAESCVPAVLLYSGRTGELIRALGCAPEPPLPAWEEEGTYGALPGPSILTAAALVPDRDGDGRAELAVCLESKEVKENGKPRWILEVLNPRDLSSLQRSELPSAASAYRPWVLRDLGDVDADETDDVLVSIPGKAVLLYSGKTGDELRRHTYYQGPDCAEGTSLDVIDDLDGDGAREYLVGANRGTDVGMGMCHLHSGATGELLQELRLGYLEDLPGQPLVIDALPAKGIGIDACALGDTNGDGRPDVAVHMPAMEEVRLLSGTDFRVLVTVSTSPLMEHNEKK